MPGALSAILEPFRDATARAAYAAALVAQGLPAPADSTPVYNCRESLSDAPALPALAVELGELSADDVAAGLRRLRGEVHLTCAVGRRPDEALRELLEPVADALRGAVESHLRGHYQRLVFSGCDPRGEPLRPAPVPVRAITVRFGFDWLYAAGEF